MDVKVKKTLGVFTLDASLAEQGFILLSGRNGSGKTSLLNTIAGILKPDEGHVRVGGRDVTNMPIEERRTALVTLDSYIPHLEVDRHLVWGAKVRGLAIGERGLDEVKDALGITYGGRVDQLSMGMRCRVALGTALLAGPDAILVDEAFSNLDSRNSAVEGFRKITRKAGIDVLFTSQQSQGWEGVDHHYAIANGKTERLA